MSSMIKNLLFCSIFLTVTLFASAQESSTVKVSAFAPVKDTEKQLRYFLDKIGKDLDDEEAYGESEQKRVGLDSSTVAVLALTLGMHDEVTELKDSASKLIELASELTDNADSFDGATEAFEGLLSAMNSRPKGEEISWDEPVADLGMLMQQVPIINNQLRRGVSDKRRFKRNAAKTAGKALTLATIAQASMMDTSYCGDEDDEKVWKRICADMRDACADVYWALVEGDQEKAKAGNDAVVKTCDACHHRFRD